MIRYFLVTRAGELVLFLVLTMAWAMVSAPGAVNVHGLLAEALKGWARHEFLFGFIAAQAIAWRLFGRLIELRVIALTIVLAGHALVLPHTATFALCFGAGQVVAELALWRRQNVI